MQYKYVVLLRTSKCIKYCKSATIKKYQMVFITAVLTLYLHSHIQCVKVVIDGTIDLGPKWNFEYKLSPMYVFEPRKRISGNSDFLLNNVNNDIKLPEENNKEDITKIIEDSNKNDERVATAAQTDSSDGNINEERDYEVTRLYKTDIKNRVMFKNPRKIKDETEVVKFIAYIKNESLKMFDDIGDTIHDKVFVRKINELKERYANKFEKFENNTKHHTIRTSFGNKNVILNTIHYSNKLLNRLVNRFMIDMEDNGLRNGFDATKTFQDHKDNLRNLAYENACKMFSICRAGVEFSDHISDLITTLLEHDDVKVQLAVKAVAKALKNADFSRIMDGETHQAFMKGLATLEELSPFELRVLLMAYKLIIDNRHQPFLERDPKNEWVKATVAMFHVMEGFNKKVIIDAKDWNTTKKDFNRWLTAEEVDIKDVANTLVNRVQNKIAALDNNTANDFKDKLRLCMTAKSLRINLSSYVQFQPFII